MPFLIMYQKKFIPRDDNVPGYIYLIEAKGYHGLFPGCYLKRCKIGLTRNPQARLQNFIDNQPPCDFEIIKLIKVDAMADIENKLHNQFLHCNVKLIKSKEWFDLNPIDLIRLNAAFDNQLKSKKLKDNTINIILSLLGISVVLSALIVTQPTLQEKNKEVNNYEFSFIKK